MQMKYPNKMVLNTGNLTEALDEYLNSRLNSPVVVTSVTTQYQDTIITYEYLSGKTEQ